MTSVALKSLMQRKLRTILTAFAIVLGVAMVSGTYILTDTIDKAFTTVFASSYKQTDAVISSKEVVVGAYGGKPTVDESLLGRVRALPGVAAAAGSIADFSGTANTAKMLDDQGRAISHNNPTFGVGVDPDQPRFNPLKLTTGVWARGPDQVVVDKTTARDHGFAVGDTVRVAGAGPVRSFTVSGIATFGDVDSLGGATIAAFDVPTAQSVLAKSGFDGISVAARPGVTRSALNGQIQAVLPASAQVQGPEAQAAKDGAEVGKFVSFIRTAFLAFAGIALFVGAFVIFNTLSITVAQRTRELATLRTLGASRRQVRRMVIVEALGVGIMASVTGLVAGLGLAKGLTALFSALGLDLPMAATVVQTRTIVVSLLVGTLVTLAAGILPAVRATRVSPIAAVREGAGAGAGIRSRRGVVAALAVTAVAGATLVLSVVADGVSGGARAMGIGMGAVGSFIGIAMLAPRLVRPLIAIVGWPSARFGGASGGLARANAIRNPHRTASTAAALMIGLALVTIVAVLGASMRAAARNAAATQISADYVVASTNGWEPLAPDAGRAVAQVPGVVASSVRMEQARVAGTDVGVTGVDPSTIGRVYDVSWSQGSDAAFDRLSTDEAIVTRTFADDHDLVVGDRVEAVAPSGRASALRVAAISAPPKLDPLLGDVTVAAGVFDRMFDRPQDIYTLVSAIDPSRPTAARIEQSLAAFPDAKVRTTKEFVDLRVADVSTLLNLFDLLLGLSVVVSLFGMLNTLVLAVFERTREIGMLRAVGMTRRQTRRMVRHEGVITALIGAAIGLPVGVGLAALLTRPLADWGIVFALPVGTLAVFVVVAIVAGVAASVMPARRAARLRPLEALHYA